MGVGKRRRRWKWKERRRGGITGQGVWGSSLDDVVDDDSDADVSLRVKAGQTQYCNILEKLNGTDTREQRCS